MFRLSLLVSLIATVVAFAPAGRTSTKSALRMASFDKVSTWYGLHLFTGCDQAMHLRGLYLLLDVEILGSWRPSASRFLGSTWPSDERGSKEIRRPSQI